MNSSKILTALFAATLCLSLLSACKPEDDDTPISISCYVSEYQQNFYGLLDIRTEYTYNSSDQISEARIYDGMTYQGKSVYNYDAAGQLRSVVRYDEGDTLGNTDTYYFSTNLDSIVTMDKDSNKLAKSVFDHNASGQYIMQTDYSVMAGAYQTDRIITVAYVDGNVVQANYELLSGPTPIEYNQYFMDYDENKNAERANPANFGLSAASENNPSWSYNQFVGGFPENDTTHYYYTFNEHDYAGQVVHARTTDSLVYNYSFNCK